MSARILGEPTDQACYYHVFSRVVNRSFMLGDEEKEQFRFLLNKLLEFSGLEAVSWCCLSNHFHILLKVPNAAQRESIDQAELFRRMGKAFSRKYVREVKSRIDHARQMGNEALAGKIITGLKGQMYDLPKFMHMLKRRFTVWFNHKHGRRGTLWEERYGSVLIEGSPNALRTMATYIDLNPVRAGIVDDPKDYRWCGYAEAVAGDRRARRAIRETVSEVTETTWDKAQRIYRAWMFDQAGQLTDAQGQTVRKGLSPKKVAQELAKGGRLSRAQLLHCRIRYFTAGAAIGGREFIEAAFQQNRDRFGPKRQTGARPMRYGDWDGLCSLRDLRRDVIGPPG